MSSESVSSTSTRKLVPATRDSGFFQDPPHLGNQYVEDLALQRVLSFYLPENIAESRELAKELSREAQFATSKTVAEWIDDAESNLPKLEKGLPPSDVLDVWGRKNAAVTVDKKKGPVLKTSEGWRKLGQWGGYEGVVAIGYENEYGPYSRLVQFAKYYLYAPSSALQTCPLAMTDGAARLLSQHAKPARTDLAAIISNRAQPGADTVFQDAYNKLISRGGPENPVPRWTSGQWMTERPGGSDVSNTETVAKYQPLTVREMGELGLKEDDTQSLGPWVIDGYKFFSSATDADMTILLAKTPGKDGLSAFYAPLKRKVMGFEAGHANEEEGFVLGEPREDWNGVSIVRLKKKLGTRPLATAELELNGMRGWLIGEEGQGLRAITTILNITRVHNSVNAVGFMRRGLAIAKAFAQVRKVSKRRTLATVPLHLRTLAHLETTFRAHQHLAFFTVSLLGLLEHGGTPVSYLLPTPLPASIRTMFLLLTPLTKILTAKSSISTLAECMESLGGVGYLENPESSGVNIQRLYRDANVLAIWEGTTNVLATELVRQLLRKVPIDSSGRPQHITSFSSPATDLDAATTGVTCLEAWVKMNLGRTYELPTGPARDTLEKCKIQTWARWQALRRRIDAASPEELTAAAREVVAGLGEVICAVLLLLDARRDGADVEVDVVRRWVVGGVGRGGFVGAGDDGEEGGLSSDTDAGEDFEGESDADYSASDAESASEASGSEADGSGAPRRKRAPLSQQQKIAARRRRSEMRWTRRADRDYLVTFGKEIEKKYGRPML